MKKNSLLFYISLALKTLAITMPHSFLTFVLLGKGVTYAQIAIIQSMFSCAMVLFEFPSGLLADRYNKKAVYIASNITLIISYFIIYKFSSYGILCLAWFLYGLSNAFQTGTIDAEMIILMKRRQDKGKSLEKFLRELNQISVVSSLLGSIIGFSLYQFVALVYALSFKVSLLFNSEVKEATISSTTSISSTIMRIFGMVTLWFAGLFLKYSSVKILFFLGTLITIVFSVIIIIYCHKSSHGKC